MYRWIDGLTRDRQNRGDSTLTRQPISKNAVVYTFPCGKGAEKGARKTLGDLFEQVFTECYGGDIIATAEAYSEARVEQLGALLAADKIDSIEYVDSDQYFTAMIGVLKDWLNEARSLQQTLERQKQNS